MLPILTIIGFLSIIAYSIDKGYQNRISVFLIFGIPLLASYFFEKYRIHLKIFSFVAEFIAFAILVQLAGILSGLILFSVTTILILPSVPLLFVLAFKPNLYLNENLRIYLNWSTLQSLVVVIWLVFFLINNSE
ncbi:hypothetical protein CH365_14490 [Leptospira neocaledonica]|uniref:Uncharacterized protein n=1 Tax=Leptospira neocaledonica TaxID=2023192 RepID=A0A2M9ZWZ5_9LEPT|nr:hypothetical protein CH365_14490 [Leptospira neocaledonica]